MHIATYEKLHFFPFFPYLKNIKKLLKIPFSTNQVSMAVHRVEKTLLLDELDLIKMLRHTSEVRMERINQLRVITVHAEWLQVIQ